MSEARRVQMLNAETVREWGLRYSNWGRFGRDDERGALNFITPACVLEACGLPRRGLVISCALPFDQKGPQTGFAGHFAQTVAERPTHLATGLVQGLLG